MLLNKYREKITLVVVSLGTLIIKLVLLFRVGDLGWEPDEYMHFAQLRAVFADFPNNLSIGLSVWAKPLYSYPLGFLVELFNWDSLLPVRVLNALIILIIGVLVYLSLRKLKFSISLSLLGLVLTNFSFLVLRSSLTALTEPIFALALIGSYYLLLQKRYNWSALLIGLSMLGRIEGALFIVIWIAYFATLQTKFTQKLKLILIAILPVVIWNFLGFLLSGRVLYIVQSGYPTQQGLYGFGSWVHYFYGMVVQEPLLVVFLILSFASLVSLIFKKQWLLALPAASFAAFFLAQVIFWHYGMFGTAGLMRYFIGVMPFMIIASFQWWHSFKLPRYQAYATIVLLVLLQLFISISQLGKGGYFYNLLNWPTEKPAVVAAGEWISDNVDGSKKVYVDLPSVIYFARRDAATADSSLDIAWSKQSPGVYVWSREWGETVHGISFAELQTKRQLTQFDDFIYIVEIN